MATETEGVDKLVAESSYVFKATVTQLNASNEPAVRSGPGLIVAHVDEAFRASPSVGVDGLRGRDVTMLLAGGAPALGDKLLVFANEWLYGVQIALREVARRSPLDDDPWRRACDDPRLCRHDRRPGPLRDLESGRRASRPYAARISYGRD